MADFRESNPSSIGQRTSNLFHHIGKNVTVGGWVHDIRNKGNIAFIELRDDTGIVQLTAKREKVSDKVMESINQLGKEDVILVRGVVLESKIAKAGYEMVPTELEILSKAESPLPLDPKSEEKELAEKGVFKSDFDTRMNNRVLDLRTPLNLAILRIQAKLLEGIQNYLNKKGFVQVFTPCIIGGASEGGAEVFKIDYFGKEAYLRQDPQLHRQLLIAAGLRGLYDLGPSWRAEKSHTQRHLCEHRGCAVELSFISDESDVIRMEESLVASSIDYAMKSCEDELKRFFPLVERKTLKLPFPEIRFPQIYDILNEYGHHIEYGDDYDREGELLLNRYVNEKFDSDFFFVNRFPTKTKPFYVMALDDEPQWARSVDLLYRGGEVSSGGQREHRRNNILAQLKERKIDLKSMEWFTEPFRYGVPPHGGFNLGIERLTAQLLSRENVREVTPFARDPERLLP